MQESQVIPSKEKDYKENSFSSKEDNQGICMQGDVCVLKTTSLKKKGGFTAQMTYKCHGGKCNVSNQYMKSEISTRVSNAGLSKSLVRDVRVTDKHVLVSLDPMTEEDRTYAYAIITQYPYRVGSKEITLHYRYKNRYY